MNAKLVKWRDYGDHIRAYIQCPDCKSYSVEELSGPVADAIRIMRDDVRYKKEDDICAGGNQSEGDGVP